jgi:hypothetical protein
VKVDTAIVTAKPEKLIRGMLGGIYEIQILSGFYYRQAYYDRSG